METNKVWINDTKNSIRLDKEHDMEVGGIMAEIIITIMAEKQHEW